MNRKRVTDGRQSPESLNFNPCNATVTSITYNQMVVDFGSPRQDDRVFHALADATRRDIVLHTLEGEHCVSSLAQRYPMSFAAVQKHVAVLEGAGLVTKQRKGREQLVRGNVNTIRRAHHLLEQLEAVWLGRIDRIGEILADGAAGRASRAVAVAPPGREARTDTDA